MQRRRTLGAVGLAMAVALVMAVVFSPAASAVSPDPNPWLQKRFLVMAHQGGEDEAPSNTMFALKSAMLDRGRRLARAGRQPELRRPADGDP